MKAFRYLLLFAFTVVACSALIDPRVEVEQRIADTQVAAEDFLANAIGVDAPLGWAYEVSRDECLDYKPVTARLDAEPNLRSVAVLAPSLTPAQVVERIDTALANTAASVDDRRGSRNTVGSVWTIDLGSATERTRLIIETLDDQLRVTIDGGCFAED